MDDDVRDALAEQRQEIDRLHDVMRIQSTLLLRRAGEAGALQTACVELLARLASAHPSPHEYLDDALRGLDAAAQALDAVAPDGHPRLAQHGDAAVLTIDCLRGAARRRLRAIAGGEEPGPGTS